MARTDQIARFCAPVIQHKYIRTRFPNQFNAIDLKLEAGAKLVAISTSHEPALRLNCAEDDLPLCLGQVGYNIRNGSRPHC